MTPAEGDFPPLAAGEQPPLVSALVSTYRASRFLPGLLADLAAQTLAEQLEIVIVDSASPENEGEIVRAFQPAFPRLVYLRTEQRENTHVALNRCLQMAKGKYVTLANTDDRHVPDAYARMVALLEARPDVALVYADLAETLNEADILANRPLQAAEISAWYHLPEFNPIHFFRQCYAGPQPMWRRSLHQRYGGFDPEFLYAGDYEFWLRLIAGGETFLHLPAVLGMMLHTSSSVSHAHARALADEALRARRRYWPAGMEDALALLLGLPALPATPANTAALPFATEARISVLLRVDRHPELLADSLETVLAQGYPHLELLLVNLSGSDLHSQLASFQALPPIQQIVAADPRSARDLALQQATGEYLLFLNSGDRWLRDHLRWHLEALQDHAFVCSDAYRQTWCQTTVGFQRLVRDLHNTPPLQLAGLLGQFRAPVACSYRVQLLRDLLQASDGAQAAEPSPWQTVEACRQAGLFGTATQDCPDWDLQWLALEQVGVHRLPLITCEYLAQAVPEFRAEFLSEPGFEPGFEPGPEPVIAPLAERLRATVQAMVHVMAQGTGLRKVTVGQPSGTEDAG